MRATASAMPTQTPPTSPTQVPVRVPTNAMPPCHLHTHTHDTRVHTHTHTHAQTHTHTLQATESHCKTHAHTNLRAHALTRAQWQWRRTLKHTMPLARSLARMGAHAPAHPARWTTCSDELLQLRQQLEAQGVELQQLRLSKAALFAAAEATASRNRDTSTRRKQRAIKSATNDTTGWPSCSKSGRKGQALRWAPPTPEGSLSLSYGD